MNSRPQIEAWIDQTRHPINDAAYQNQRREEFDQLGALVLRRFFSPEFVNRVVAESTDRQSEAFYANSTHNVYLTPPDPRLPEHHAFNRQLVSSKGLIADDQVPQESPLRDVYEITNSVVFFARYLGSTLCIRTPMSFLQSTFTTRRKVENLDGISTTRHSQ